VELVGVRDLKARLSAHLRRAQAGARLTITDRGRAIATIGPAESSPETGWAVAMAAEGHARWNGGKPRGATPRAKLRGGSASAVIIEDRR